VIFHGGRCYNHCQSGPVLKVNDAIYEQVTENNVTEILDEIFQMD